MIINALEALSAAQPALAASTVQAAAPGFGTHVMRELQQVNQDLLNSEQMLRQVAAGEPVPLHTVMIHMEETRLAFQTLVQVRNKVLEAYQDLMRMQV
jgi:flagellar hook-basal body complex protein FliE